MCIAQTCPMYAIQAPHQAHTSMFRLWSLYYGIHSDCSSWILSLECTSRGLCILIHRTSPHLHHTYKHAPFRCFVFRCHTGNSIHCNHYPKIKLTWIEAYSATFLSEYSFSLGLISFWWEISPHSPLSSISPRFASKSRFKNGICSAYSVSSCEGKSVSLGFASFWEETLFLVSQSCPLMFSFLQANPYSWVILINPPWRAYISHFFYQR
jgi:hypothetical protein